MNKKFQKFTSKYSIKVYYIYFYHILVHIKIIIIRYSKKGLKISKKKSIKMKPYIVTHWLASLNDNFIIYLKIYTVVITRSKDRDPSLVQHKKIPMTAKN